MPGAARAASNVLSRCHVAAVSTSDVMRAMGRGVLQAADAAALFSRADAATRQARDGEREAA